MSDAPSLGFLDRYSRHLLLQNFTVEQQHIIGRARVLVVGAGGLGASALPVLAGAGVGELIIVDDDVIELSNLPRQTLYGEGDLGAAKAEVAARLLREKQPSLVVEAQVKRFAQDQLSLLDGVDLVLDCSDNLATRNLLNEACCERKTPLVSAAAIRFEGQLMSFPMQANSACYACYSQWISNDMSACAQAGVFSPVVAVMGTMQAAEGLKLLAKIGANLGNRLVLFDAYSFACRELKVKKDPNCSVCKKYF